MRPLELLVVILIIVTGVLYSRGALEHPSLLGITLVLWSIVIFLVTNEGGHVPGVQNNIPIDGDNRPQAGNNLAPLGGRFRNDPIEGDIRPQGGRLPNDGQLDLMLRALRAMQERQLSQYENTGKSSDNTNLSLYSALLANKTKPKYSQTTKKF